MLLGVAGSGAVQAFDLCFYGNDLLLCFGLGVDAALEANLHALAQGLLRFDLLVNAVIEDDRGGVVSVFVQGSDHSVCDLVQSGLIPRVDMGDGCAAVDVVIRRAAMPMDGCFANAALQQAGERVGLTAGAESVAAFLLGEQGKVGLLIPQRSVLPFAANPLRGRLSDALFIFRLQLSKYHNARVERIEDDPLYNGARPRSCALRFDACGVKLFAYLNERASLQIEIFHEQHSSDLFGNLLRWFVFGLCLVSVGGA